MFSNKIELQHDVREFTTYPEAVLSDNGLETAYKNAKRHIRIKKSLAVDYEWFDPENAKAQDALYWWTCLFAKVETGELDAQGLQTGAVDANELLAKDDDSVTVWYRQAESALDSIKAEDMFRASSPARGGRTYEAGSYDVGNTGGSGGSSTEVDGSDI
jgi:hypothetical protein